MNITPVTSLPANGVTTGSLVTTTDKARLYVKTTNGFVSARIIQMLETGDWVLTDSRLQLSGGGAAYLDLPVEDSGVRLHVLLEGAASASGVTVTLKSLSAPVDAASNATITPVTAIPANGVTTGSFVATSEQTRLFISSTGAAVLARVIRMMENGDWVLSDEQISLTGAGREMVYIPISDTGERLHVLLVGESSAPSGVTFSLKSLVAPSASSGGGSLTFKPQDYGAVGDGVADDGPAWQTMMNAVLAAKGGTIVVEGKFKIATPVAAVGAGTESVKIVGVGANVAEIVIACGNSGQDCLDLFGYMTLLVSDVKFSSDGVSRPFYAIRMSATEEATFERVILWDLIANQACLWAANGNSYVRFVDCHLRGGQCDGTNSGVLLVEHGTIFVNLTTFDGTVNGASAWVMIATPSGNFNTYPVLFENAEFDEVGGRQAVLCKPTGGARLSRLEFRGCDNFVGQFGMFEVHDTDVVVLSDCKVVERYVSLATLQFYNCGKVRVDRFQVQLDLLADRGAQAVLTADNLCGTVEVIDCDSLLTVSSDASTTLISETGRISYMKPSTSTINNALAKADSANPGQFVPALHTDVVSAVVGVQVAGAAFAQSGAHTMPAPGSIPNGSYWYINNDDLASNHIFEFRKDGGGLTVGNVLVNIQTAVTAADVATAFAAAINASTGANFSVSATPSGSTINIIATVLGWQYNRNFLLDVPFQGLGFNGMIGGSSHAKVACVNGQRLTVTNDGVGAIAAGDPVTLSTTTDGQCKKATAGNIVGRALTAAAAVAGTTFDIIFSKEAI